MPEISTREKLQAVRDQRDRLGRLGRKLAAQRSHGVVRLRRLWAVFDAICRDYADLIADRTLPDADDLDPERVGGAA